MGTETPESRSPAPRSRCKKVRIGLESCEERTDDHHDASSISVGDFPPQLDAVILLAQGYVLYSGPVADAVPWFERRLSPPELHVNPADYLISIAAIDTRTREAESVGRARVNMLVAAWKEESVMRFRHTKPTVHPGTGGFLSPGIHPRPSQSTVHSSRTYSRLKGIEIKYHDLWGVMASWIEAVLIGPIVGLVFLPLPNSMECVRSRQAPFYISIGFQGNRSLFVFL